MLVLGGARSGKSAHAEGLVGDAEVTYVATARPGGDPEWSARIAEHAARRPPHWHTIELARPAELSALLAGATGAGPPILVDDLASWLTTLLDDHDAWDSGPAALGGVRTECGRLVDVVAGCRADLVLVSAEVGLGVVPHTSSGRLFRDELGALNAALAQQCTEVVLLVAGIALRLR
jgi:adenosylcobinamide kinase / adenosylcobinamide-phosphate guanylyltransferase